MAVNLKQGVGTGFGGQSATLVCNRISWLATSTFATRFFCRAYLRQAFATKVCNNKQQAATKGYATGGGGGAATKQGLILSHIGAY